MGCHRGGRGVRQRVHALQGEAVLVQLSQHGVACRRAAAQRGALDDLGHVLAQGGGVAQHLGQHGKHRGVAGAPGNQHVGRLAQRTRQCFGAALAHDVAALQDVGLCRACHRADGLQLPGPQRLHHQFGRQVTGHRGQAKAQALGLRNGPHHGHGRVQLRPRPGGAGAADDQRDALRQGRCQHQLKVAVHHGRGRCHLARAQVIGAGVDRAHVAADQVRPARQPALQGGLGNAIAQLARGSQDAQRPVLQTVALQQALAGTHGAPSSRMPSMGACCCAPYTSPSPGVPAHNRRGSAYLMASSVGSRWRCTWAGSAW